MLLGTKIKFELFDTGYCIQDVKMVFPSQKKGKMKFHALTALLNHPIHGWILFDTGYGKGFFKGTEKFPYRLYRYATPVTFTDQQEISYQLIQQGVSVDDVKNIIMSHFHGDHTGGLWNFKQSKIHTHPTALAEIKKRKGIAAVRKGMLPGSINMIQDKNYILFNQEIQLDERFFPFTKGYDVFGDGSIIAVDLPGHASGQTGILFDSNQHGIVFLCADSAWSKTALHKNERPHWMTHFLMDDKQAFQDTFHKLNLLIQNQNISNGITVIPTHCEKIYSEWQEGKYKECF